jgi:hypothetical protein
MEQFEVGTLSNEEDIIKNNIFSHKFQVKGGIILEKRVLVH